MFWTNDRRELDAQRSTFVPGEHTRQARTARRIASPHGRSLRSLLFIRFVALPVACVLAAVAPQAAAAAPCVSSTPAVVSLADAPADAEAGAPEISAVRAAVNADCTVSIRMTVENRDALRPDDALLVYLNTDGNAATGARSFGGADQGVGLVADEDGPGYLALLGRWDPAAEAIDFENATELDISPAGWFGFTAGIDELGLRADSTLGISIAALSEPDGEIALDFAPDDEGGALTLPIAFSTTASTAPAPPTTTPTAPGGRDQIVRRTCKVPKTKHRTVTAARKALRAAGCRVGKTRARYGTTVRKGRVVATLPAAGKRIAATRPVTILVSR